MSSNTNVNVELMQFYVSDKYIQRCLENKMFFGKWRFETYTLYSDTAE